MLTYLDYSWSWNSFRLYLIPLKRSLTPSSYWFKRYLTSDKSFSNPLKFSSLILSISFIILSYTDLHELSTKSLLILLWRRVSQSYIFHKVFFSTSLIFDYSWAIIWDRFFSISFIFFYSFLSPSSISSRSFFLVFLNFLLRVSLVT